MAEGQANIVFSGSVAGKPMVLRCRKRQDFSAQAIRDFHEGTLRPLLARYGLEHCLAEMELVPLTRELVDALAAAVAAATGQRRPAFRTQTIDTAQTHGLLMPNYRADNVQTVEFKTKWLTFTATSVCRTCGKAAMRPCANDVSALARMRCETGVQKDTALAFCPLGLLSRDAAILRMLSECIVASGCAANAEEGEQQALAAQLARTLQYTDVFVRLAAAQAEISTKDDVMAMTLRDCTVFISGWDAVKGGRILFVDLDPKSPDRREKWRVIEERLLREGYYSGRASELVPYQCLLENEAHRGELVER